MATTVASPGGGGGGSRPPSRISEAFRVAAVSVWRAKSLLLLWLIVGVLGFLIYGGWNDGKAENGKDPPDPAKALATAEQDEGVVPAARTKEVAAGQEQVTEAATATVAASVNGFFLDTGFYHSRGEVDRASTPRVSATRKSDEDGSAPAPAAPSDVGTSGVAQATAPAAAPATRGSQRSTHETDVAGSKGASPGRTGNEQGSNAGTGGGTDSNDAVQNPGSETPRKNAAAGSRGSEAQDPPAIGYFAFDRGIDSIATLLASFAFLAFLIERFVMIFLLPDWAKQRRELQTTEAVRERRVRSLSTLAEVQARTVATTGMLAAQAALTSDTNESGADDEQGSRGRVAAAVGNAAQASSHTSEALEGATKLRMEAEDQTANDWRNHSPQYFRRAFACSLILAAMGFRALVQMGELRLPTGLEGGTAEMIVQFVFFLVDVLLSALLLAGGSQGVHAAVDVLAKEAIKRS